MAVLLGSGWLILNAGYGFQGTFQRLGEFDFVSRALRGRPTAEERLPATRTNRFHQSLLGKVPVPLPRDYVTGIDLQMHDFEEAKFVYLGQDVYPHGVWYFYLYAALVKLPLGFLILLGIRVLTLRRSECDLSWLLLLCVPVIILMLASSLGRVAHFRYLMPVWPFLIVWVSGLALAVQGKSLLSYGVLLAPLTGMVVSSLSIYPHSLSYFNEAAGGPGHGHAHLIDSHIDWGQDLLLLKQWWEQQAQDGPLMLAYRGPVNPAWAGIDFRLPPGADVRDASPASPPSPGWSAISVHFLQGGMGWTFDDNGEYVHVAGRRYTYFLDDPPVDRVGYSILIYRFPQVD
jgi:hypothetical protein